MLRNVQARRVLVQCGMSGIQPIRAGRMNELTITLITPTLVSEGRRVTMTLSVGDGIEDYWRACKQFALGAGYHPETVAEYFSEEE